MTSNDKDFKQNNHHESLFSFLCVFLRRKVFVEEIICQTHIFAQESIKLLPTFADLEMGRARKKPLLLFLKIARCGSAKVNKLLRLGNKKQIQKK